MINIAGSSTPTCLVAIGFQAIDPGNRSVAFVALLALAAALTMGLNFVIAQPLLPWFLTQFPANKLFQDTLKKFAPGLQIDSSSLNGWGMNREAVRSLRSQ